MDVQSTQVTYHGMGTWNVHKILKRGRGSQATGRSKGIKPTGLQKWMCRHNRSWKHPQYGLIMSQVGKRTKTK